MTNVYFAHFTQNCGLKLLGQLVVGACLFLAFLSSSLDERLSTVPAISLRTRSLFDRPFVGVGASEKTTATTTMSPVLSAWIEIRGREVERTEISRFGRMERVLNIAEVRRRNVDGSPYLSSVAVVAADADRVGAGNGISARRSQWRWQARTATTPSRISNIVTWNNHRSENAQGVGDSKAHWSRIQSHGSFLDFIDRCIHEVSKNLDGCRTENNFVRLSKFLDRTLKLIARMSKNFDKRGESYQDDIFPLSDMLTAIIKTI